MLLSHRAGARPPDAVKPSGGRPPVGGLTLIIGRVLTVLTVRVATGDNSVPLRSFGRWTCVHLEGGGHTLPAFTATEQARTVGHGAAAVQPVPGWTSSSP